LRSVVGKIPMERLNIHGGGVSLGHPVGASGARIVLHLARVLEQKKANTGIASLCIGGGQGGAMLIDRSAS
jgi:acetyl-CoA C-acetyltransferase